MQQVLLLRESKFGSVVPEYRVNNAVRFQLCRAFFHSSCFANGDASQCFEFGTLPKPWIAVSAPDPTLSTLCQAKAIKNVAVTKVYVCAGVGPNT